MSVVAQEVVANNMVAREVVANNLAAQETVHNVNVTKDSRCRSS